MKLNQVYQIYDLPSSKTYSQEIWLKMLVLLHIAIILLFQHIKNK